MKLKFEMQQHVKISETEAGEVIARVEYSNAGPAYLIRYKCADGRLVEVWWSEDVLSAMPDGFIG